MSSSFDPYHRWLGIRPEDRPITYYRLLGLSPFEDDPDVIESAADQRMAHVRSFHAGKYSDVSQRILNELSKAKLCLLNEEKKAAYDRKLEAIEKKKASASHSSMNAQISSINAQPPPTAVPAQPAGLPAWLLPSAIGGAALMFVMVAGVLYVLFSDSGAEPAVAETQTDTTSFPQPQDNFPPKQTDRPPAKRPPQKQPPRKGFPNVNKGGGNKGGPGPRPRRQFEEVREGITLVHRVALPGGIRAIALSPDDKLLALGGDAGQIRIVDLETAEVQQEISPRDAVLSLAFSADSHRLLAGFKNGLRVWEISGDLPTLFVEAATDHPVTDIVLRPQQPRALLAGGARIVEFNLESKQLEQLAPLPAAANTVMYLPGSEQFLIGGGDDETANPFLGVYGPRGQPRHLLETNSKIRTLAANGMVAAGVDEAGTVHVWNIRNGRSIPALASQASARTLTFLAGRYFVIGNASGELRVRDIVRRRIHVQDAHQEPMDLLVAASTLPWIVTASEKDAAIWKIEFAKMPPRIARRPPPNNNDNDPPEPDPKGEDEPGVDEPTKKPPVEEKPKPPSKLDIPSPDALREALALIHELFEADYQKRNPQDQVALADKLLRQAEATKDDPTARYALLTEAVELAKEGGDAALGWRAIETLGRLYKTPTLPLKVELVKAQVRGASTPEANAELAQLYFTLIRECVHEDAYTLAVPQLRPMILVARKANQTEVVKRAQAISRQVMEMRGEYRKVESAIKSLADQPENPQASAAYGRYLALNKGDWEQALPLLAQGNDEQLSELAREDLSKPEGNDEQIAVGDRWWDLGEKMPELPAGHLKHRAAYWYSQALEKSSGLTRTKLEQRIKDAPELVLAESKPPMLDGPQATPVEPSRPAGPETHREIATQIINAGGYVYVHGTDRRMNQLAELPRQPFALQAVYVPAEMLNNEIMATFGQLKSLEGLYMLGTNPNVTDEGLAHLRNLPRINRLSIYGNFTDAAAEHLSQLQNLQVLSFNSQNLSSAAAAPLTNLPALVSLQIYGTQIDDEVFAIVGKRMPRLNRLTVTGTFTGTGLAELAGHQGLQTLQIRAPQLNEDNLQALARVPQLRSLRVESTPLTNAGLSQVARLPLNTLQLSNMEISDEGLAQLGPMPRLTYFSLFNITGMTGTGFAAWKSPVNRIQLTRCRDFSDEGFAAMVRSCQNLGTVQIQSCPLTDAATAALVNTRIRSLMLEDVPITDRGLAPLARMPGLQFVNVQGTRVSEAGALALKRALPECRVITSQGRVGPR